MAIQSTTYSPATVSSGSSASFTPRQIDPDVPWLSIYLNDQWPGGDDDGYVNAYAAAARVILIGAAAGTLDSHTLSSITGLPELFVAFIVDSLNGSPSALECFNTLQGVVALPYDFYSVKNALDPLIETWADGEISIVQILKLFGSQMEALSG